MSNRGKSAENNGGHIGPTPLAPEAAVLLDRMMAGEQAPTDPVMVDPLFVGIRESTDFL